MQKIIILILLTFAFQQGRAQRLENPMPLPIMKGVKQLIILSKGVDSASTKPKYSLPVMDTSEVHFFDKKGRLQSSTFFNFHSKLKDEFTYNKLSQVISKQRTEIGSDTITIGYRTTYEYKKSKLIKIEIFYCDDVNKPNEVTSYSYSKKGKLQSALNKYIPTICSKKYYNPIDSTKYLYKKDTLYRTCYAKGKTKKYKAYFKLNKNNQLISFNDRSERFKSYLIENNKYNKNGDLLERCLETDIPSIQADGLLIRYDCIKYVYNNKVRPIEKLYFTKNILRRRDKYIYIDY